jgi:FkbM family methyltransferase
MRRVARWLIEVGARQLSFDVAMFTAKQLLAAQGFGSGGIMYLSGELAVFRLINSDKPLLFDVGAHIGEYTEKFLQSFPNGRSFAFEPSSAHLTVLRGRLSASPHVTIFPVALGSEVSTGTLHKDKDISGLASLTRRRLDHMKIELDRTESVSIRTLDDVVTEVGDTCIDLLKIDVEGHDLDVLKGSANAMEKGLIKLVQFEFGGCNLDTRTTLQDFWYFFQQYGFAIGIVLPSMRVQPLPRYDEFYEQYRTTNFIAAPRGVF